ncbi:S8 family serine peptidase [Avibacterium sp. 21-599]|uniref:S8 family serine peptidase n=1 Tax=Avibacterium sp. 21-599 TaxID=2911528 RepID=UPI0022456593|nr:S8 family serine peptidase [Avibacterium sp. 21-599]MCW9718088.1 S8 family serine peptidase [Avibacterium sp. 21-599]
MNSPRLFSLSPLVMAITLALFPYLAQGNQNDAENRQDAVAKLAHLSEAQAQPHQWQDTDHNHINQDKLATLRAMLVDTGVDLHTFEKDEIYPESIVAHGFYDPVSHHITTQLSPDMTDDGPEMHGTKMARVLLNTAGGGSIYPVQGLVRKRGEPVPHWRNRLLAMGVANERSIAQTGRAAPVVANIWVEGISEYAQPEYIEKLAHIANQGSLLLFANGNEPLDPAIPNEPYSSVSRMLAPNSEQLDERLKDSVIAITAITKGKQKYQPCGKAKNFCLAANADTAIHYFDPLLDRWIYANIPNGTSSATAYASGVALAIAQKYDWFKAKDIRNTLFTTANDKGDAGIDAVYGVGEINKQKALNGYGRFDAQNNNVLDVNGIAERYYFDNDIEGDSGFTKRGDKELVLNGNNRFQGKGVIEQGKLTINGTNTAQFEIKQGATLATGTSPNKISTGSLYNSGRLEVINPSPLYIEGDFTNTESGEINTAIGSSINVSGRAILNGVMQVSQIAQGYVPQAGRREVLLRANELVDDGIRLHLDSALIHIADTIAFDQNKKQIYVGLQRKRVQQALEDLDTPNNDTENPKVAPVTEETIIPATTETVSTAEKDNSTEIKANEHSEETSTTEETTVPATTETASTVEKDNSTEIKANEHSEGTSTAEETIIPATTETASAAEKDNSTEIKANKHSEGTSSIDKKNKAQRAYLGAMEDARLLDRVLEKLDQGYASQQLNTQQKQWANRLFNIDRTHFTEYLFSQGIQSLIHQQQSWVNHEAFQRLNWIASFSQKNHTALWISGENRSASPDVSHINTTDHFNSVAINGLLVEGKHRFSFSISEQRQKYEEHYKEVEKSFNERDVAFRLGYGYEFIPNWTLLTSFNYGVGKLKYQQQFNTQNTHSQGNTQSYASTLGIHWSQPINAQWIWHNIANIDYTHKQLTHLMLNDDVKINRLVTEQTNIGVISELEYKLKNLTLFGRLALQKTLHNKNRGRVSYATTSVDIEQSYRLYPDWKPQFGIGMGYQYHNWRFSLSGDMAKDHYHRVNVSVGYSF